MAAYQRVIAEMPSHADAHHLLGVIALGQGRYAEAVHSLRIAVSARPDSAQYAKTLGSALISSGDPEAAAALFTQAIRLQPNYPEAYYGLGSALRLQGRYREAACNFYRALLYRPGYAGARRNLVAALSKLPRMGDRRLIKRNGEYLDRNHRMSLARQDWSPFQDPRPPGEPANEDGFTLLETLIVLVVLSLMAGLVLARGPSRSPTFEVRAAAANLAQTLRGARAMAILTGAPARVEIDLLNRQIRSGANALILPASVRLTYTAVSGRSAAGRAVVAFGADGSSSGGVFGLFLQAVRSAVTIDAFTGRVDTVDGS